MFARFDENPAITLQDIKETKRYRRTDNLKTVYSPQSLQGGGGVFIILPNFDVCSNFFSSKIH